MNNVKALKAQNISNNRNHRHIHAFNGQFSGEMQLASWHYDPLTDTASITDAAGMAVNITYRDI